MTKAQYTKQSKTFVKDASIFNDVFVYGRKVGGVYVTQRQPLTYRSLQRTCRDVGISAKGSANDLRKALWMAEHGGKTPNAVPLTRRQRQQIQDVSQEEVPVEPVERPGRARPPKAPRAKTQAKLLSSIGLSYRDSQKFVSFWKSEDRLTMPAKNAGWENVEHNISHILNQPRFWGWAATEHGKAKLSAMGVSI